MTTAPREASTADKPQSTLSLPHYWLLFKSAMMIGALLWMLVYRLSEAAPAIPNFVYANL
jgi:hypothetical protein